MYDIGSLRISLLRCRVSLCLSLLSGEETSFLDLQRQGAQRALKQALIPSPEKGSACPDEIMVQWDKKKLWPALIPLSEPHHFQHFHGVWPYDVPLEVIPVCVGLDTAENSQGGDGRGLCWVTRTPCSWGWHRASCYLGLSFQGPCAWKCAPSGEPHSPSQRVGFHRCC